MKFSILIPLYNVERYIKECLDSCINQTFPDFEIIIINDGSTDESLAICSEYIDSRIRIYNKKNAGLLMARRDAIKFATGEYLIFLDSDDKLRLDCLEYINDILENSSGNYDLILYNLYKWDMVSGETLPREPVFKDGTVFSETNKKILLERFLLTDSLNNIVLKAVKREVAQLDDTPYGEMGDSSYGEDRLQSFYVLSQSKRIYYSAEPLYYYRNNPNSITRANVSPEKIARLLSMNVEYLAYKYANLWGLDTPENIDRLRVNRLLFLRYLFMKCFDLCSSRKQRLDCLRYDWFKLVHEKNVHHLSSKRLTLRQKIELRAILKKKYFVINTVRIAKKAKKFFGRHS